jgi:thymidine kinase
MEATNSQLKRTYSVTHVTDQSNGQVISENCEYGTPNVVASKEVGSLTLYTGPMFSGKSSRLVQIINTRRAIGQNVLVINHALDTRFNDKDTIMTHDEVEPKKSESDVRTTLNHDARNSIKLLHLEDLFKDPLTIPAVNRADVICIDELQFFDDALRYVPLLCNTLHKQVYAAGLIADYQQKAFGDVLNLIPHADTIIHCTALCTECNDGTVAPFTQRLTSHGHQILVGAKNAYRSVCRKHYNRDQEIGYPYENDQTISVVEGL